MSHYSSILFQVLPTISVKHTGQECFKYISAHTFLLLFHDWNVALDGYRLFRRDRQGRRGEGVALYIKKTLQSEELSLKNSHEQVESLWVRIGEATKGT